MYQLTSDLFHNKLMITLRPNTTVRDFNALNEQLRRVIPQMRPDFTIITNLTQAPESYSIPQETIIDLLTFIKRSGVGKVIRVVGSSKQIMQQLYLHTLPVKEYPLEHVPTLTDAIRRLPQIG